MSCSSNFCWSFSLDLSHPPSPKAVHNQTEALTKAGLLKGKVCVGGGSNSKDVHRDLVKTLKSVDVMKYTNRQ